MAISPGTSESQSIIEINTTPLIDVMLVLLIMFILTIPAQTHSVKLNMPAGSSLPVPIRVKNLISTDAAGDIFWNGQRVPDLAALRQDVAATLGQPGEPELHIRPDPATRYEVVDGILSVVKRSDVPHFGFEGNERYRDAF